MSVPPRALMVYVDGVLVSAVYVGAGAYKLPDGRVLRWLVW